MLVVRDKTIIRTRGIISDIADKRFGHLFPAFTEEFIRDFCTEEKSIDWIRIVKLNAENKKKNAAHFQFRRLAQMKVIRGFKLVICLQNIEIHNNAVCRGVIMKGRGIIVKSNEYNPGF
jgi:hypothetical protein